MTFLAIDASLAFATGERLPRPGIRSIAWLDASFVSRDANAERVFVGETCNFFEVPRGLASPVSAYQHSRACTLGFPVITVSGNLKSLAP
jgi:hypothetical protein